MGFFDAILKMLFGGKKTAPPEPKATKTGLQPIPTSVPRSAPSSSAPPLQQRPAPAPQAAPAPVPMPQSAPAPQPAPTPSLEPTPSPQPPAASSPTTPPASTPAPALVQLSALVAADRAKLAPSDLTAAAQALGVDPLAVQAVMQVESGGQGFAADGRPIILFEPTIFSVLTNRRFDSGNPNVSQATAKAGALGVNQADRWSKLQEAYGLEPETALQATAWGLFQLSGASFAAAGYPSTSAMVADMAKSEARQLAGFVQYVRGQGVVDALKALDWDSFARGYGGHADPASLAKLLNGAYVGLKTPAPPPPPPAAAPAAPAPVVPKNYLSTLVTKNPAALTSADIKAAAERMGCEQACVRAVLKVESKGRGFAADGRPVILFEPHVFSKQTTRKFDISNPTVSYKSWGEKPYPGTQAGRYAQLEEAFALDAEAAVSAASWGLFQILGLNYKACGFASATAFVSDMAQSEARQLLAFEAFVRANKILDELQKKDWAGFARVYNGPGQVEKYAKLLSDAYAAAGVNA